MGRETDIHALVEHWYDTDEDLDLVVDFTGPGEAPVRLLQVTASTPASPDSVQPFGFAPSTSFPHPLEIAQVTPGEWARIQARRLLLPEGWSLDDGRPLAREAQGAG